MAYAQLLTILNLKKATKVLGCVSTLTKIG